VSVAGAADPRIAGRRCAAQPRSHRFRRLRRRVLGLSPGVSATDEHRRCRLQPTCSLFAARAARRFGLLRGLLMGLARSQMSHGDQDGFLPRALASDGQFIYLDPVERWIHGDL
jgi:hypothetical protein